MIAKLSADCQNRSRNSAVSSHPPASSRRALRAAPTRVARLGPGMSQWNWVPSSSSWWGAGGSSGDHHQGTTTEPKPLIVHRRRCGPFLAHCDACGANLHHFHHKCDCPDEAEPPLMLVELPPTMTRRQVVVAVGHGPVAALALAAVAAAAPSVASPAATCRPMTKTTMSARTLVRASAKSPGFEGAIQPGQDFFGGRPKNMASASPSGNCPEVRGTYPQARGLRQADGYTSCTS